MTSETQTEDTSRTVPLSSLRENDYNPRKDIGDVSTLAESIEKDGLIQALTVRPIDNGTFEVISGMRRLTALREVYGDNRPIEVVVRDVDDETARRLALKENIEREDLTDMEEASAFAREIAIETADGSIISFEEAWSDPLNPRLENISYPSSSNGDIKSLAENLGVSASYVADHILYITLPEPVQNAIDERNLTKRAARMIARIDIEDPEDRARTIESLADDYSAPLTDDDYDDLSDAITSAEEEWERRQKIAEEAVQEYAQLVDKRRDTLIESIEEAGERLDLSVQLSGDIDELAAEAEHIAEVLDEKRNEVSKKVDGYAEERDEYELALERTQQALSAMAAHDDEEECPYCGSDVTVNALGERRDSLTALHEEAEEGMNAAVKTKSAIRELRTDLLSDRTNLLDAREAYNEAREKAEAVNAD